MKNVKSEKWMRVKVVLHDIENETMKIFEQVNS